MIYIHSICKPSCPHLSILSISLGMSNNVARESTGWRPVVAVFCTFNFLVTDILCLVIQYFGSIN